MRLVLSLSFRNLLRQKRRNIFLGLAISIGMTILVLANSFSHGISDTLLNRMIVYITGHLSITVMEDSNKIRRVIRDRFRFMKIVQANFKNIKGVYEAVGTFGRVVGNSKGDNAVLVGTETDKEFIDYIGGNISSGDLSDFTKGAVENPVILFEDKAKTLGVKNHDILNVRTRTVTGQEQTARMTVVAILKSSNMFEGMVMYLPLKNLKQIMGLKPHETGSLQINFKKMDSPRLALREAERLFGMLKPGTAFIRGEAVNKKKAGFVTALGYSGDEKSRILLEKQLAIIAGSFPEEKSTEDVMISGSLAAALNLKPGGTFKLSYKNKYENTVTEKTYSVAGIFSSGALPKSNIIFMNEKTFYKTYLAGLPDVTANPGGTYTPDSKSALFPIFSPEWKMLKRSSTMEELQKKLSSMNKTKWPGPWLDVRTMYETADFILKLEFALNLVAFIAVLILFFIILIGVLNSLRMTIRERTREIGTIRAIGMQKTDVKYLFISETLLLTAIACLAGIAFAFILMGLLGLFTINTDSIFSILLVNRRLNFFPTAQSIAGNFALIMVLAAVTAYFPARRASNLSAVEALRHFE